MITKSKREIKAVRRGDDNFWLSDGMVRYPRAMMHITPDCPADIAQQIHKAEREGWLKAVAYVQGKELTWQELTK